LKTVYASLEISLFLHLNTMEEGGASNVFMSLCLKSEHLCIGTKLIGNILKYILSLMVKRSSLADKLVCT
jgi:hypothetical protein